MHAEAQNPAGQVFHRSPSQTEATLVTLTYPVCLSYEKTKEAGVVVVVGQLSG